MADIANCSTPPFPYSLNTLCPGCKTYSISSTTPKYWNNSWCVTITAENCVPGQTYGSSCPAWPADTPPIRHRPSSKLNLPSPLPPSLYFLLLKVSTISPIHCDSHPAYSLLLKLSTVYLKPFHNNQVCGCNHGLVGWFSCHSCETRRWELCYYKG